MIGVVLMSSIGLAQTTKPVFEIDVVIGVNNNFIIARFEDGYRKVDVMNGGYGYDKSELSFLEKNISMLNGKSDIDMLIASLKTAIKSKDQDRAEKVKMAAFDSQASKAIQESIL